jgi:hypothetical protein
MRRLGLLSALVLGILALAAHAQAPGKKDDPPGKPKPEPPPLIKLAPQAAGKAPRALKYRLLPDPLDVERGNAATLWVRAGRAARAVRHKWTEKEYSWGGPRTSLQALPRKEVRALLDRHATALRLADQAARRDRCDWDRPPLTLQTLQDTTLFGLLMDEVQFTRELANLLSIRCRLELAEGRFEDAARTLQTGFALARHVGNSDMLLDDLVGLAITSIMLGRVEEWVQLPGSPNLYWALTALPRPFIDVRRSMESERGTLYRSFPQLREMRRKTLTPAQARKLAEEILDAVQFIQGGAGRGRDGDAPGWAGKMGIAALTLKHYPDAKKYLLARGYTAKQVEAMPAIQAVVLHFLDEQDRVWDDVLKWMSVPPWRRRGPLEKIDRELRAGKSGNVFMRLLMPAILKVHEAQTRTERYLAGLRGAEALRHYAAAHGGKPPARWADITETPPPTDPVTGKGLDSFYSVKGGKAVLDVPPLPGQPPVLGRRFEWAGKGEAKP